MLCTSQLFGRKLKKRQLPIVDLDKVIHKAAWKLLDIPGPCGPKNRFCKQKGLFAGVQITWNKSVTDKFSKSETLKWGVDSAVTLADGQRALASLSVLEATLVGIIKIRTDFKLTNEIGLVVVDAMSYDGDELVGMAEISADTICQGL